MPQQNGTKINCLLQAWPSGTVATQAWLTAQGVSSNLASYYVRSGWLVRFGPRAFVRAGDAVDWRGGVYALQTQLDMTAHLGARTALELQGRAHYIPLGPRPVVRLISDSPERFPTWFATHSWRADVRRHTLALFRELPREATAKLDCGGFKLAISAPERAIMEEMRLVLTNDDVEHTILLMEGLITLRPRLVQELLEQCTAIKVKRLFLSIAERVGHSWVECLDLTRVELGVGKRQVYKGGRLDPKYAITVPPLESLPDV
jgi:hypothetical protein